MNQRGRAIIAVRWGMKILQLVSLLFLVAIFVFLLLKVILTGYMVDWTGFGDFTLPADNFIRGKTLWDWMQLFIIPIFLSIGVFFLNQTARKRESRRAEAQSNLERELATESRQEGALQAYLDRMADLLIKEGLRKSSEEEVRQVARVRTLTVLRSLDSRRKGVVLLFLKESGLIAINPIISLYGADFSEADLTLANLAETNLCGANLTGAKLNGANLMGANLFEANLTEASLSNTNLSECNLTKASLTLANLTRANLTRANLSETNLNRANLNGAILDEANLTGAEIYETELGNRKSLP